MNKEIKNISMPINKIEFQETINPSLSKCSIYVMHTGENFNGSSFSEESVQQAKQTLKNIPILASIKRDEDYNAKDFEGHEMETRIVEKSNGECDWKIIYIEKPIGVIPESNNYRIEEVDGEKWVVVDGYIWKEYSNGGYDLLRQTDKKVSMEISVDEGYFDDKFMYHINKYNYLGVTVLGDDCPPAMGDNAIISLFNTNDSLKDEYEKLLHEVENFEEGGVDLEQENIIEENIIEENFEEDKVETVCPACGEELDSDGECPKCDDSDDDEEDMAKKKKKCSSEEIETVIEVVEIEEKHQEDYEKKFNDTSIELTNLKASFVDLQANYSELETEVEELRTFKANIEKAEKEAEIEAVLNEYSALVNIEGYEGIIKERFSVSLEELEKSLKVFAFDNDITIKKVKKELKQKETKQAKFSIDQPEQKVVDSEWSILDKYIKK